MFGADGKLQPGTFELKVSASDNSGNVAEYAIKVKGYTKDAPTITFVGEAEREFDAGKKFDTASLKAVAKDGNGKKLSVKFSYSEGARNSDGTMKQGSHKLYLTATDDEGQQFVKAITLNCYDYTYLKVTGFYYFLNDELYISTNMKNPEPFKGAWLTSDNLLINDESGAIPWVAVDQNTGSLYVVCKKEAGDVMTIAEGATFVDDKNYVGIKVENQFKAHTDGIGWIVDRIPRGRRGNVSSPATGDNSMWIVYVGVCVLSTITAIGVYSRKKKQS
jgi:LPXTG-motif cell wall-anchored protein